MSSWITRPLRIARDKVKASRSQQSAECSIKVTDPTEGVPPAESSQNGIKSQAGATVMRLPVELQAEIFPYLSIYDQVRAALAYPLWEQILAQKSFQITRYSNLQYRNAIGYHFHILLTSDFRLGCRLVRESNRELKLQLSHVLVKSIRHGNQTGAADTIDMMNHVFLDDPIVRDIPQESSDPESTNAEKKGKIGWLPTSVGYVYKDNDTWVPKIEIPDEEIQQMTIRDFFNHIVGVISNPENMTLDQALALPPSTVADEGKTYSINVYPRGYNFGIAEAGRAEKSQYHLCLGMDIS
ncbi:hypothetical protein TWF694_004706 [Orbilia ellipsospora]|uniref:F-box domain-containing protein n=1 Tax=Orbilia ellipsospora TaxID=2528407 RepID=A0AAV9WXF2_9PEZI